MLGIVQGGAYQALREQSAAHIGGMPFEGFAIGGSLGPSQEDMRRVLEWSVPPLPADRPRHLIGIGEPADLFDAVERGIDSFDCVSPTRLARRGVLYTSHGRITVSNAEYRMDFSPVDEGCGCYTCSQFTRAYLHHLFVCEELLAYRLATIHNLYFLSSLMARIRHAVEDGADLGELRLDFMSGWKREEPLA
jgi:tRNA-guanine transglycosylase